MAVLLIMIQLAYSPFKLDTIQLIEHFFGNLTVAHTRIANGDYDHQ